MNSSQMTSFSPRERLVFYYRYRVRLLLAFLLPMLAAVLLSYAPAPNYKASSVLAIRPGAEFSYQSESGSASNATDEIAVLNSDNLHTEVIQKVGADILFGITHPDSGEQTADAITADRLALEKALIKFNKRFDVNSEGNSSVITITFEHKDPELAVQVLDTLLDLYIEKRQYTGSVRIIQAPAAPKEAKNLQPMIITGGFVLSILCMIVVAILTDMKAVGFATPEQLERMLRLPVLAVINKRKD